MNIRVPDEHKIILIEFKVDFSLLYFHAQQSEEGLKTTDLVPRQVDVFCGLCPSSIEMTIMGSENVKLQF